MSDKDQNRSLQYMKSKIWPTSGPGYTNHPKVDIRAHRKNAQFTRISGIIGALFMFLYAWLIGDPIWYVAGLAFGGWANWFATENERKALEWELQLEKRE